MGLPAQSAVPARWRQHPQPSLLARLRSDALVSSAGDRRLNPDSFRDKVELTRVCVASIRRCAGSIPYELVLIDNGSCDEPRRNGWISRGSNPTSRFCVWTVRSITRGCTTWRGPTAGGRICCCSTTTLSCASSEVLQRCFTPSPCQTVASGTSVLSRWQPAASGGDADQRGAPRSGAGKTPGTLP